MRSGLFGSTSFVAILFLIVGCQQKASDGNVPAASKTKQVLVEVTGMS